MGILLAELLQIVCSSCQPTGSFKALEDNW